MPCAWVCAGISGVIVELGKQQRSNDDRGMDVNACEDKVRCECVWDPRRDEVYIRAGGAEGAHRSMSGVSDVHSISRADCEGLPTPTRILNIRVLERKLRTKRVAKGQLPRIGETVEVKRTSTHPPSSPSHSR